VGLAFDDTRGGVYGRHNLLFDTVFSASGLSWPVARIELTLVFFPCCCEQKPVTPVTLQGASPCLNMAEVRPRSG
jgi:hypothetical protein